MQKVFEISQKIIEYSFYILLFITPFIFSSWNSELFELPKMYFTFAITTIIVGAWLTKSVIAEKPVFQRTILDIPLALFLFTQAISTYFSIDQHTSVWGYYSRMNGGLLSLTSYSLLYWAFVSNMHRESALLCIRYLVVSAGLISLYAILERLGVSPSCYILKGELNTDCWVQRVQERAFATLGQPNWLAAWLAGIFPLSLIYTIKTYRNNSTLLHRGVEFTLSILTFLAIIFTKSRSGLIGLGVAFALFTLFATRNSRFSFRPFLLLTTIYILLATTFGTPWTPSLTSLLAPTSLPTTHNPQLIPSAAGGTESGEIRKIIWDGAVNIWRAAPVFGTGPETFAYSYWWVRPLEHNLTSEWELLYNKAHNEYLNYLANTGTVGFVGYMLPILAFLIWTTRTITNKSKLFQIFGSIRKPLGLHSEETDDRAPQTQLLVISLLAGYTSILVTNFFGFSTVNVATLFYLFPAMAMVLSTLVVSTQESVLMDNPRKILSYFLTACVLGTVSYILLRLATNFRADLLYAKAEKLSRDDMDKEAVLAARDAINLRGNEPLYFDELAKSASYVAINFQEANNQEKAQEMAALAHDSTIYATYLSPYHLTLLKSQSLILLRLSLIDQSYLEKALYSLEQGVMLAPTDPKVHYNLGVLYHRLGEDDKARTILEKAVSLKPDYYDAHTGLGEIYEKLGEAQKAREQYEYILQYLNPEDEKIKEALQNLQE